MQRPCCCNAVSYTDYFVSYNSNKQEKHVSTCTKDMFFSLSKTDVFFIRRQHEEGVQLLRLPQQNGES